MSLEISGTTGIKGVAGSVSAPSLTGDDANSGISFPAADTIKFSTAGIERLALTNNGLETPNSQFDFYIQDNNEFRFEADGDFHADGDVIAFSTTIASDERLKENIEIITNPLEKLKDLRGVSFNWIRDGKSSAGVIAQDVMLVLPEAVKEVKSLKDDGTYLSVNYQALTSILIEAVKELSLKVEKLEGK